MTMVSPLSKMEEMVVAHDVDGHDLVLGVFEDAR